MKSFYKNLSVFTTTALIFFTITQWVLADNTIDQGFNYLRTQQDETGKISGFGGESQWAAIAFSLNSINISTVKNGDQSLKDFLLQDIPTDIDSATEWERRILAIVAIGEDPSNFNSINYVQKLEEKFDGTQIGSIDQLNDDIFGLLALISAQEKSNVLIKQSLLDYIIAHQNFDGGFSWSTNPAFNTSDSNDTSAAIQALVAAKNNGFSTSNLEQSLQNAANYLVSLQTTSGGFLYDTSSWTTDPDGSSTSWALMALNVLGLGTSTEAINAKTWLLANQEIDGGFHWMNGDGSDTSTTSHALIALLGKSWFISLESSSSGQLIATPSATILLTPTPSISPSPSPTYELIPTQSPFPVPSPSIDPTQVTSILSNLTQATNANNLEEELSTESSSQVLGTNSNNNQIYKENVSTSKSEPIELKKILLSVGSMISFLGAVVVGRFKII